MGFPGGEKKHPTLYRQPYVFSLHFCWLHRRLGGKTPPSIGGTRIEFDEVAHGKLLRVSPMVMPRRLQRRTAGSSATKIGGFSPKIQKISSSQKVREENNQKKRKCDWNLPNIAPENGWSEDDPFLFGKHLFSGFIFHDPGWWKMINKNHGKVLHDFIRNPHAP